MGTISSNGRIDGYDVNGIPSLDLIGLYFFKQIQNEYFVSLNGSVYKSIVGSQQWRLLDTTGLGKNNDILNIIKHKNRYIVTTVAGAFHSPLIVTDLERTNQTKDHFSLSPNPASYHIKVEADCIFESIELYNSTGNLILTETSTGKEQNIDIKNFPSGIYFLKVIEPEKVYMTKIVIEK